MSVNEGIHYQIPNNPLTQGISGMAYLFTTLFNLPYENSEITMAPCRVYEYVEVEVMMG